MQEKFNDVPWDASLFNGASLFDLNQIVTYLDQASYHYADDSGKEWGSAAVCKGEAAKLANTLNLNFSAVDRLVKHHPQLVTVGEMIDAMFRELRK